MRCDKYNKERCAVHLISLLCVCIIEVAVVVVVGGGGGGGGVSLVVSTATEMRWY